MSQNQNIAGHSSKAVGPRGAAGWAAQASCRSRGQLLIPHGDGGYHAVALAPAESRSVLVSLPQPGNSRPKWGAGPAVVMGSGRPARRSEVE